MNSGFKRVDPTEEELATWYRGRKYPPSVYRVECLRCGARLWGSGLGIGSHDRACRRKAAAK